MRAIDTNVLVRFLTADDPAQAEVARHVFAAGDVFIGNTVILETEWVLRAGYDFSAAEIGRGFRGLGGLAGVTIEEPAALAQAIDLMEDGMDFADALHLVRSNHCRAFLTFDRKFAGRSKGKTVVPIETL